MPASRTLVDLDALQVSGRLANDAEYLRSVAQEIAESLARQHAQLAERMRAALVAPWAQLRESFERSERAMRALEKNAFLLGSLGWTVPLWAPPHILQGVVDGVTADQLDDEFFAHYSAKRSKHLKSLLKELLNAPTLLDWRPMLAEIVSAYDRKQYLIAVPSLLVILEGIVADHCRSLSISTKVQKTAGARRAAASHSMDLLLWASVEGFLTELYRYSDFGQSAPAKVNRHWILHGRQRPSWTRLDCIRLFHAVHTLSA